MNINFAQLNSALSRVVNATGDSNRIMLTYSPSTGMFGVSAHREDLGPDELCLINQASLNEWNQGGEWNETFAHMAALWVAENLEQWLKGVE